MWSVLDAPGSGWIKHDERKRDFPAELMRYAHDACISNVGIIVEATFQLCGRDLESSDFHDFLWPRAR
jgi:hypothetical protein